MEKYSRSLQKRSSEVLLYSVYALVRAFTPTHLYMHLHTHHVLDSFEGLVGPGMRRTPAPPALPPTFFSHASLALPPSTSSSPAPPAFSFSNASLSRSSGASSLSGFSHRDSPTAFLKISFVA